MDVHKLRSTRPIVAGSDGLQPQGNFSVGNTTNAPVYTNQTINGDNAWAKEMNFDDSWDDDY